MFIKQTERLLIKREFFMCKQMQSSKNIRSSLTLILLDFSCAMNTSISTANKFQKYKTNIDFTVQLSRNMEIYYVRLRIIINENIPMNHPKNIQ